METSWLDNKMVMCGPFVGSIEEEILSFNPFVNGLKKHIKLKNFIVSTHYNRKFLYDNVIPIFKQYTKDEESQVKHKHEKINSKDYIYLTNEIKDQLSDITNFNKSDIVIYNLGYSSYPNISHLQKVFKPLDRPQEEKTDSLLFIPEKNRPRDELQKLFEFINNKYNVEVYGDKKSRLQKHNTIIHDIDYYDKVYECIFEKIMKCKAVIVPCSHGTVLCNIYNIPVFSWGKDVTIYKDMYGFDNEKSYIIPYSTNNVTILMKSIEDFLRRI